MQPQLSHSAALERRRNLLAKLAAARARPPARRRRRRAWLAAALPLAVAAIALPATADAAQVDVSGTTLFISDLSVNGVNNAVGVSQLADGRLVVTDSSGLGTRRGCVTGFGGLVCSGANQVQVDLRSGGDSFFNNTSLPTTVFTGAGNDALVTGGQPGPSQVSFVGGDGRDTVTYERATRGVSVTEDNEADDGRPGDRDAIRPGTEILIGSVFADDLTGDSGGDVITGLGGDDVLNGGAGFDAFDMQAQTDGADRIFGGADFDEVNYSRRTRSVTINLSDGGADDGEAGEGDELRQVEKAVTGSGSDTLKANPASTTGAVFAASSGTDTITGTNADDIISADAGGRDTIHARGGADVIITRDNEADSVACGTGIDTLTADSPSVDRQTACERVQPVGVLRLGSRAISARVRAVTRMQVAWTHPRASARLAKVAVRVRDGQRTVGEITIRPRTRRITGEGATKLVRSRSRLSRRGKTVRAQLSVRMDPSLAGVRLVLDIEATDTAGRRQIERGAGVIRVAG